MDILILGSTGAGAAIGSQLSAVGHHVAYLDDPSRAFALDFAPLRVASAFGDHSQYVNHLEAGELRHAFDLVIVACAAHRLREAAMHLSRAVGPSATVLVLSPGARTAP